MSDVERERLLRRSGSGYTASAALALAGTGTEVPAAQQQEFADDARARERRRRAEARRDLRDLLGEIERGMDEAIDKAKSLGAGHTAKSLKDGRLDVRGARRHLDGG
jgi:hypothetical protein